MHTDTAAITLTNRSADGDLYQAVFLPEKGMNLISFRKGEVEVIDQSTWPLFEERYAGLGALIGPHFHHRKVIPPVLQPEKFPFISKQEEKGLHEHFSHGIARYAPWKYKATETTIEGKLTGKDLWNEIPLSVLEGQKFSLQFKAELTVDGLVFDYSVVSETDSIVGFHYYYSLVDGAGILRADTQENRNMEVSLKDSEWDHTFHPALTPCLGKIELETGTYRVIVEYSCVSQENSWQLYHPKGASFVCIEPLSARDPHHTNLTVSSLKQCLRIDSLLS